MTRMLRAELFENLMRQHVGFYDDETHKPGTLGSKLSGDVALVQATTGPKLGLAIQNNVSLLAGIIIAFSYSWRLTLVVIGTAPLMILTGIGMMKIMLNKDKDVSYSGAGSVCSEAVANIRTVASFGFEERMLGLFETSLGSGLRTAYRTHFLGGLLFAVSQFIIFCVYAVCFYAGSQFIEKGWITFMEMLQVFFAIAMSAMGAGQSSSMAGDQAKAEAAKISVFELMDMKSKIDPLSTEGIVPGKRASGKIEFRNVSFAYPGRPDFLVLKHASFTINAGDFAAFVGSSGCGKSTIVRLLLRYYDATRGQILLDDVDITTLNIGWLRAQFGLVSQEPDLFDDTLAYNILYGKPDADLHPMDPAHPPTVPLSATEVPADVVEAAQAANAAGFIDGFDLKYNTVAGEGGSQLSGGQKQRVAIARAIVRQPSVLLLDEATSALDSESEKIVQTALDGLCSTRFRGVTTLVIAHRLSTIRHAHTIVVLNNGRVMETGDHDHLMATGGRYASLVNAQTMPGEGHHAAARH